jgi:hypothetical protein
MANSNRPSKWADPSVRPTQSPFTPSPVRERRRHESAASRKRNGQGQGKVR